MLNPFLIYTEMYTFKSVKQGKKVEIYIWIMWYRYLEIALNHSRW